MSTAYALAIALGVLALAGRILLGQVRLWRRISAAQRRYK